MQYNGERRNRAGPLAREYAGGGRDSVLSMLSGQDTRAHSRLTATVDPVRAATLIAEGCGGEKEEVVVEEVDQELITSGYWRGKQHSLSRGSDADDALEVAGGKPARMNGSARSMIDKLVRQTVENAVSHGFDMAVTPLSSRPDSSTSGLRGEDRTQLSSLNHVAGFGSRLQPGLE
jgi:hypothetical protein